MAYPTWLMFASNNLSIGEFFSNISTPLNCVFLISTYNERISNIKEVYKIGRDRQLRSTSLGTWGAVKGFNITTSTHYERRHNLFGYNLRVNAINVSFQGCFLIKIMRNFIDDTLYFLGSSIMRFAKRSSWKYFANRRNFWRFYESTQRPIELHVNID